MKTCADISIEILSNVKLCFVTAILGEQLLKFLLFGEQCFQLEE
jgi:hypothetical protein